MSKIKSIIILVVVAVLVIGLGLLIFPLNGQDSFEIGKSNYDFYWVSKSIKLGLDLEGGMYVVYTMDLEDIDPDQRDSAVDGTIANLEALLFSKGYTEATVTRQGNDKLRVEIPSVDDTEALMALIGEPARLEFRDESGNVLIEGGKHLEDAQPVLYDASYAISLKFNDEGTAAFATATKDNVGKKLAIYINGEEVMAPTVNAAITDGNAVITGNYTQQQASEMAIKLQAGTFAVALTPEENSTISATLGQNALQTSLIAGAIGLGIIIILMIIIYKAMGLVAAGALVIYTVIMMYALAIVPWVQLTLPSIAGIILSIGMAVDANVIIFERIKDERLTGGKSIRTSVQIGFKKALSAILDGNITTILGSIVMIIFGATTIKSFGITLLIGIVISMFTALVVTRLLINIALAFNEESDALYGLRRRSADLDKEVK
ncbi:MAG: protein translocase subunit SecD [Clostridia bacterium]|nr:protein translocase subunit SecD [Clostridia bacterium]